VWYGKRRFKASVCCIFYIFARARIKFYMMFVSEAPVIIAIDRAG
jgi:hypothetical protein